MSKFPCNRLYMVLQAVCLVVIFLLPSSSGAASKIITRTMPSQLLAADYPYTLYLPDGYESGSFHYPVLYLLHGNGGNETDWSRRGRIKETVDRLIRTGQISPLLVVMPGHGTSWWVDGNQEPAERVLIKELIPHIDKTFHSLAGRKGRMIAGISAGGYGTVNAVFKYPELFVAAAALSPAVYVPRPPLGSAAYRVAQFQKDGRYDQATWERLNYPTNWKSYKAKKMVVPLYISSGDHDRFAITWHASRLFQLLFEYQPQRVELRVVDGDHNWQLWRSSIEEALKYMTAFARQAVEK